MIVDPSISSFPICVGCDKQHPGERDPSGYWVCNVCARPQNRASLLSAIAQRLESTPVGSVMVTGPGARNNAHKAQLQEQAERRFRQKRSERIRRCRGELRFLTAASATGSTNLTSSPRARGAGRPRARRNATSSRSSGSGGDSSGSSEPPGEHGRLCICGCGRVIPQIDSSGRKTRADRKTFDASCRKRIERQTPAAIAAEFRDPYLRADSPGDKVTRDDVRIRVDTACRCNGHRVLDARDGNCVKCGHSAVAPFYPIVWDRSGSGELAAQHLVAA